MITRQRKQSRLKSLRAGGWAGMPAAEHIWNLPKRELVELALRLGASASGGADDSLLGLERVEEEIICLKAEGVINGKT